MRGLDLSRLNLTSLTLPPGMTNLTALIAPWNKLTSLTIPPGMTNLVELDLTGNQLSRIVFSEPLPHLSSLILWFNPLTSPPNLSGFTFFFRLWP